MGLNKQTNKQANLMFLPEGYTEEHLWPYVFWFRGSQKIPFLSDTVFPNPGPGAPPTGDSYYNKP